MKKKNLIVVGIIVIIVLVVGGILIFHKSPKTISTSTTTKSQRTAVDVDNAVLITKTSSSVGQYLAEPNGTALYTYGGDSSGVSNCTGSCLASWPAYQDKGSTTGLPAGVSTITRTDNGQTQYTYNGMPLYTFTGDTSGKVTGNGVSDFSVAKPAAPDSSQPTTATTPAQTNSNVTNASNSGSTY